MGDASRKVDGSKVVRSRGGAAVFDVLTSAERAAVLDELLDAHPELRLDAEQAAHRLLASVTVEEVANDVSWAMDAIALEDLGGRAGRVPGRGYVHETEAAWELVHEAVEPFMIDMRRRAGLGLLDAARAVAMGIVAGLHEVGDPADGSVVAYAGPDSPGELADEVLTEASRLGVDIPDEAPGRYWPDWRDLT